MKFGLTLMAVFALVSFPVTARTLLVLPVTGDLEKASDASTVNELYKDALQASYPGTVKTVKDTGSCADKECAAALAKGANADEAVYSTLKRLGSKWIFSSTIVNADGRDAFNQRGTATNLEDLEAVTKRVSDAIVARKSVDQVASLDNITAKEENSEPTRRMSLFNTGFSLGYLLPTGGTYAYLKSNNPSGFSDQCPCTEKQAHSAMCANQPVFDGHLARAHMLPPDQILPVKQLLPFPGLSICCRNHGGHYPGRNHDD